MRNNPDTNDHRLKALFGEALGTILAEQIPAFVVELGKTVAESGMDFHNWLAVHEDSFRALAAKYTG